MGEGNRQFGAYLRRLREERRVSLPRVAELSLAHSVRISQAHLSRCENGLAAPSLERLSVLSKILGVDLGRLVECSETFREIADQPGVDLTGETFETLHSRGVQQALRGELKAALSTLFAAQDLVSLEGGQDAELRGAKARLSLAIVLGQMGKYELACEEAQQVTTLLGVPESILNKALLQVAVSHHRVGRIHLAAIVVEGLERRLESLSDKERADLSLLTGDIHYRLGHLREAIKKARAASSLYRKLRDRHGESSALHNAGVFYLARGEADRAIAMMDRALQLSRTLDRKRQIGLQLTDLAKALISLGRVPQARKAINEALEIGRNGDYHDILFSNYFLLWRLAGSGKGDHPGSSAIYQKALRTLLPKVEETLDEASEFRRLQRENEA